MINELPALTDFEWDEDKRVANVAKHGIDFEDALLALAERGYAYQTERNGEIRTVAVCPENQRLIAVVYVMRGHVCRIISARVARTNERRKYYESFH